MLNVRDLEQKNNSILQQIKKLERDVKDQKNIIESLKSQLKGPDVHLRTEVNILKMEKAKLQQKLEAALASKQKYKIQWGKIARRISVLHQKFHEMIEKDEELTSVQQHISAFEEENAMQTKEEILEMVKDKVESLKSVVSPESAKLLERQMSLNIDNSQTVPTSSSQPDPNIINKSNAEC